MSDTLKLGAIFSIAAIEMVALAMGHNGQLLTLTVGMIAGIAGYGLGVGKHNLNVKKNGGK